MWFKRKEPAPPQPRGSARDVLDFISLVEHAELVHSRCDGIGTTLNLFHMFVMLPPAQRGFDYARSHGGV